MIFRPTLPPLAGYVEVEVDGARTYVNAATGELLGHETPRETPPDVWADMAAAITEGVNGI